MKRWLCSFFLAVGVVFLLWIPHRSVRPHLHPQATANRSVLSQNEFVSTRRALQAASPTFPRSRVGPVEFFAPAFGFLITDIADDDALPWLDYRGPPGPNACNQGLVTGCKAARQVGSLTGSTFQRNSGPRRANLKHGVLQHALASRIRTQPHDRSGKSGNEHPGRQLESLPLRHGKPAKFPCAKINSAVASLTRL